MNRKEQIDNAANNYSLQFPEGYVSEIDYIRGAEWADENPKDGLVEINKVCLYLKDHLFEIANNLTDKNDINRFIENLRNQLFKTWKNSL